MTTKQRYKGVIEWFEKNVPVAETELQYRTPFELLVAVILSAQCTDKRINMVTPALFEAYPTAEAMSKASAEDIFEYIKIGVYKHIPHFLFDKNISAAVCKLKPDCYLRTKKDWRLKCFFTFQAYHYIL